MVVFFLSLSGQIQEHTANKQQQEARRRKNHRCVPPFLILHNVFAFFLESLTNNTWVFFFNACFAFAVLVFPQQVPGKTRVDVVAGTNILKSGGEDVKIMEDEAYPEWLYKIAEPQPSLTDLRAIVGNGEGLFELDGPGRARYLRLERRDRIKSNNKRSSK